MRSVYGNSSNVRQHALQRALGQVAVADLAAAGAAHRAHFTRGERREVVVQHERLRGLAGFVDGVEALHVVGGAERDATSACVCPRVNSAEPCARGSRPVSIVIGRTSFELAAVDALARRRAPASAAR